MCPLSFQNNDQKYEKELSLLETGDWPSDPIKANLVGDKVLVFNHVHGSLLYGYGRYFGIPVGIRKPKLTVFERPLELSYFETLYLLKQNLISLYQGDDDKFTLSEFNTFAKERYPQFEDKYIIYEDMREKNYVPRPGQKFGADFIVYQKGPGIDHSSFCIQVLSRHAKIGSIDVVRSARLATSVKKRFILANPITKNYFSFKWHKP